MTDYFLTRKVLITIPDPRSSGGVSMLFRILKMDQIPNCSYFNIQPGKKMKCCRFVAALIMYISFFLQCFKFKIIHLNPSLNRNSYYREMFLIIIAKLLNCKIIVYWHGWQNSFEEKIKKSKIRMNLFLRTYGKVNLSFVLGSVFKHKLLELGYKGKVIIGTNSFDDTYLKADNFETSRIITDPIQLLFLSRIKKQKGIYITIDTHQLLLEKGHRIDLTIAGDGDELKPAMKYVDENNFKNITFTGFLSGIEKHQLFKKSHILLFPSFSEGLPLTVLEAMAYGLAVITRPVGGIPDIIENEKNGYLTESLNPEDFVALTEILIKDHTKYEEISKNNISKAKSAFLPENLRFRLVETYNNL